MAEGIRVALVLSAGGLRGAAHVGVLRQLLSHQVPIHTIVGVSAGAVVGAYYAAVGLDVDELIDDARAFRGRHLLTYGLNVQLDYRFEHGLRRWCGVIPDRLRQLEAASFERLHHGVQCLGITCHDLNSGRPRHFRTGLEPCPRLDEIVKASASIPRLFPSVAVTCGLEVFRLTDGGISESVPLAAARDSAIGTTHVIVSDCRWLGSIPVTDDKTIWIRPRMPGTGTLWSPRRGLLAAVRNGEESVNNRVLARIDEWFSDESRAA